MEFKWGVNQMIFLDLRFFIMVNINSFFLLFNIGPSITTGKQGGLIHFLMPIENLFTRRVSTDSKFSERTLYA